VFAGGGHAATYQHGKNTQADTLGEILFWWLHV
jgi:hypothetical protein